MPGLVKSGQDRSSKFGSNIKSGQVNSSWDGSKQVMTGQVKSGLVKSDRSTIFCIQNLFVPKMHLRMEFDSGVGPTCNKLIVTRNGN